MWRPRCALPEDLIEFETGTVLGGATLAVPLGLEGEVLFLLQRREEGKQNWLYIMISRVTRQIHIIKAVGN